MGTDVLDDLRFAPLAAEFAATRERRGLDLKAAAKALKRPQFVVRQIEQGRLAELDPGVLDHYSDVAPPVWRRVLVTDDTTLHGLHEVIQVAMGWTDTHLYRFELDGAQYFDLEVLDDPDPDDRDARTARLAELGLTKQRSFLYDYDFGDGWSHTVTVERVGDVDVAASHPRCLAGARACPPEDCGGPPGYQDLLSAMADPAHPEHKESRRWVPKDFDPEAYDVESVNAALASARRVGRRR